MTATHTQNVAATVAQVNDLAAAGADLVRVAVDSTKDAEALAEIRRQTTANLAVDLQENYRLASQVAPHVDKLRYNPGHLYHHEPAAALARQGEVPGRRGRRARLRPADRRQLRIGRSGQTRTGQSGRPRRRFARSDGRQRAGALRAARSAVVHPLLRLAEGFRSGQGDRGQSPVRRRSAPTCRCTWA